MVRLVLHFVGTTVAALVHAEPDLDALTAAGLGAFIRYLTSDPRRARVVLVEVVGVSPEMETPPPRPAQRVCHARARGDSVDLTRTTVSILPV